MSVRVYIGNMSFVTTEDTLKNAFGQYGNVLSAEVIRDKFTEQSKGFGFVEMENEDDAKGRRLRVNFAEQKPPRKEFRR